MENGYRIPDSMPRGEFRFESCRKRKISWLVLLLLLQHRAGQYFVGSKCITAVINDFIMAVNWKKAEEYLKAGKGRKQSVKYAHNSYSDKTHSATSEIKTEVTVLDAKDFRTSVILFHVLNLHMDAM